MPSDLGGLSTQAVLLSLVQLFLNATVLFALAAFLIALALGRYLAVARLHRLALVAVEVASGDESTNVKGRIAELVRKRLRGFDQSFVERHKETPRYRQVAFVLGSALAIGAVIGVFVWLCWVAVEEALPGVATAIVASWRPGATTRSTALVMAGLVIVVISVSFGFLAYVGIQLFERARSVYLLLKQRKPSEPGRINRYDLSVMSIGIFAPMLTLAVIVAVITANGRFGMYSGKLESLLGRLEQSQVESVSEDMARRLEALVASEYEVSDLDQTEAGLIRGAVVQRYFVQPSDWPLTLEAHIFAHILRATGDDYDAVHKEVQGIADSYRKREWQKRKRALREAARDVFGAGHRDDTPSESTAWFGPPAGDDHPSLSQLENGALNDFVSFMQEGYYAPEVWTRRVLPRFPGWPGISGDPSGAPFEQDGLAGWVVFNREQLKWSATRGIFELK